MKLQIGDPAPTFECQNQHNETVTLEQFKGKKVILYFYPKDNTPGCTAQSCNLRDHEDDFRNSNYEIIGVSKDSVASHQKFADQYNLPFHLLADTDKKIHEAYGTWGEKKLYGKTYLGTLRTTFVIDETGHIADIIQKVKTKEHHKQITK